MTDSDDSLVSIGNGDPGDRPCVTTQKEEGHVAGSGDHVDHHGQADGPQGGQVQPLHQQAPEEYAQARTRDGRHTCSTTNKQTNKDK